ncbi:MBL fold metallo-hydrolase [Paenibacillus xanthanilyticus]|uniref:MBL fold metallo-hydrolase n=1 Tax=Paenibacillus xanthanilyticus TaxID=1783531 RepID=A0ABV8KB11_9BACL
MRYTNMNPEAKTSSFADLRRWRRERAGKMKTKDFSWRVPTVKADLRYLRGRTKAASVTWIGHSTFLIRHSGLTIVTDPVWAETMGFQKRLAPPGIEIGQMPPVDVVLLSHSHYDHLHLPSLKKLIGDKRLIVPVGLGPLLRKKGFEFVTELQWWEQTMVNGVRFTFVPAQHWTRRTLTDTNRSHWGGFVIEPVESIMNAKPHDYAPETIYFAGDSGYFEGFKQIGERFRVDVALMPIGAYEPEWFMKMQHVTPEEALQAFLDVGARLFIPMHYGAFALADDTPREALNRLEAERARLGIEPERIEVLPQGRVLKIAEADAMTKSD